MVQLKPLTLGYAAMCLNFAPPSTRTEHTPDNKAASRAKLRSAL